MSTELEYFAGFLTGGRADGRVLELRNAGERASFRYVWGQGTDVGRFSVSFMLELHGQRWLLHMLREDEISPAAFAIAAQKALRGDDRFSQVRWFTEDEWMRGKSEGNQKFC